MEIGSGYAHAIRVIRLSDRQAAHAVRARLDWKYALGLELEDRGFDFSVLSEFRSRLIEGQKEYVLFETMLTCCKQRGLITAGGRQRTDATHVLGAVRAINRVICVGPHNACRTQFHSGSCPGVVTLRGLRTNGMSDMNAALRNIDFAIRARKPHSAGRSDRSRWLCLAACNWHHSSVELVSPGSGG